MKRKIGWEKYILEEIHDEIEIRDNIENGFDEEDGQETDKVSVKSDEKEGSIKDAEENDDGKVVMYDSEENEVTMEEYKKKFKGFKNKKGK